MSEQRDARAEPESQDHGAGTEPSVARIAVIGTGMIGRSWTIAFARGGCTVAMHDPAAGAAEKARNEVLAQLDELATLGLLGEGDADQVATRICVADTLADALDGVDHVQENAPETLDLKRALFAELDALTPPGASIASSSSALLPSVFVPAGEGAARCLVAHPLNPPHLVPAVELVPGPHTAPAVIDRVADLMTSIGQQPIVLTEELEGFVMNRLQGALLDEAMRLIEAGIVSVEGVDRAVKDGLGLRWSFMGPIETIDLNAPGGVLDFLERYGPAYAAIAASRGARVAWDAALAGRLDSARRASVPRNALTERREWRDQRLMALALHKARADDD